MDSVNITEELLKIAARLSKMAQAQSEPKIILLQLTITADAMMVTGNVNLPRLARVGEELVIKLDDFDTVLRCTLRGVDQK